MKRKIVGLLGCCILAMAFTACGEASDIEAISGGAESAESESVESASRESVTESDDIQDKDENTEAKGEWVTREMEDLTFPDTSIRYVDIVDGVKVAVGTTPFNYDFAEMEEALRANEYIAQNYDLRIENKESCSGEPYTEGDFYNCTVWQQLTGEKKDVETKEGEEYQDFWFTVKRDLANYDNISYIAVGFKEIDDIPELQETMYDVLNDILGEDIAEYMVYANQDDAVGGNLAKIISASNGAKYGIQRDVSYSESNETWSVEFALGMNSLGEINGFGYYHGDYVPMVANAHYNVSAFTNGGIDDFDINNFSVFGSKYAGDIGTFAWTGLTSCVYMESIVDDGETEYFLSLITEPRIVGMLTRSQPSIHISSTVTEKDGAITYLSFRFTGNNKYAYKEIFENTDGEANLKKMLEIMKDQIAAVVPNTDLSDVTYENMMAEPYKGDIDISTTVTVLGVECDCKIHIDEEGVWNVYLIYE